LIPRYSRPEMSSIWENRNKYEKWLQIEIVACEAMSREGLVPKKTLKAIKEKADFDEKRVDEIERTTKHDVIAFLTNVAEFVGEDSRYIHLGMTSSDILDTSLALLMKEASDIIINDMKKLLKVIRKKALKFKDTVIIGRSHGIHAEPTTFGLKLALMYEEIKRGLSRMERAKEVISYGKISGAVGTFAQVSPSIEEYVCKKLGLKPAPISTQIIQRDRHAEYLCTLALIASSIDKYATEIRHLQRTEVREAEEFFSKGQKGSSAMPHKRNPITSEQLSGLARVIRGNAMAAMENIPLWHERDISHSSVERVIIPDSTILIDYMLNKFTNLIDNLLVYPENMKKNLEMTGGLIFSQRILLELAQKGVTREKAYEIVQRNAMKTWLEHEDFQKLIRQDSEIKKYLSKKEIDECFELKHHLRHVDTIFKRVFGKN
jgi:adenylosuccinate lyase